MEFFKTSIAIKLRSHHGKYLTANDDKETVRQTGKASTEKTIWVVETVQGKTNAIRLKSCHGRYLSASDFNFLFGMTGKKVIQTKQEKLNPGGFIVEWEPIRDGNGEKVKLMSWCGTYLRANGVTPPWRNSITHDDPSFSKIKSWILWEVEAVEVLNYGFFMGDRKNLSLSRSSLSSSSSSSSAAAVSDEFSCSDVSSPASIKSVRRIRSSIFQVKPSSDNFRSSMEFFRNAKTVRLRSSHDKYLVADDDEESVTQDRSGSSKNSRWSVEFVSGSDFIRLKSCYGKYLTASNHPFLLGMTGRKVLQTLLKRLDSSVEWEPIREGTQVKFKTRYGNFLRANGGLPPWRNTVTHDIPSRTATQDWIIWGIDVLEIQVQSFNHKPSAIEHMDSLDFNPSSPPSVSAKAGPHFSRLETSESSVSSPPKSEGRLIYYHVADESGEVDEETVEGFSFSFKGNGVEELTHKLEEETGIEGIIVCTRSPLNGNLFPLRLQLPPNNATIHVVVVPKSSKAGQEFSKRL